MKYLSIMLILLIGCNHLKEGEVLSKHYEPTNSYMMLVPIIISSGKNTSTVMIPHYVTDYEDWVVEIEGTYNGEKRTENIYITKEQYKCLQKGSYFKLDSDCSTEDENNQKEKRNKLERQRSEKGRKGKAEDIQFMT